MYIWCNERNVIFIDDSSRTGMGLRYKYISIKYNVAIRQFHWFQCLMMPFLIGNFRNLVDICLRCLYRYLEPYFKTPFQSYIQINKLHQSRLLKQHFDMYFWPSPRCYLAASFMQCNQVSQLSIRASERQPSHSGTSHPVPLTIVSDGHCWKIVT